MEFDVSSFARSLGDGYLFMYELLMKDVACDVALGIAGMFNCN